MSSAIAPSTSNRRMRFIDSGIVPGAARCSNRGPAGTGFRRIELENRFRTPRFFDYPKTTDC